MDQFASAVFSGCDISSKCETQAGHMDFILPAHFGLGLEGAMMRSSLIVIFNTPGRSVATGGGAVFRQATPSRTNVGV